MLRLALLAASVGLTWYLTSGEDEAAQEQEPEPGPEPVTREDLDDLRAAIYEAAEDAKLSGELEELPAEIRAELEQIRTATADELSHLHERIESLDARNGDGTTPDPVEPTDDEDEDLPED